MDMQVFRKRRGWRAGARLGAVALALGALAATTTGASTSAAAAKESSATVSHSDAGAAPVVSTAGGAGRGKTVGTADEFLGIPYAAPPVGPLRWRPPQPAGSWSGVRDATAFAPDCAQPGGLPSGIASVSENCLYLNVYAPAGGQHSSGGPAGHGLDTYMIDIALTTELSLIAIGAR